MASSTSFRKIWPMPARRSGNSTTPVDQPPVVGPDAGQAMLVVLRFGRRSEQHEAREERRHRVGEHHLADHAVGFLLRIAHLVVPVAEPAAVSEVAKRVLVPASPCVEVLEIVRIEILAVHRVAATGVTVGGDDGVAVLRCLGRIRTHGASRALAILQARQAYPWL